jgi:hypothetical protein
MMIEELEADIRADAWNEEFLGACEDCEKPLRRGDKHEIRFDTLLCANCDEERSVKAQERRFHAYWEG